MTWAKLSIGILAVIWVGLIMNEAHSEYLICTDSNHIWPESIDIDAFGNLYFSDAKEKALFRIERNQKDGRLGRTAEKVLKGFKHLGGVSIDRSNHSLYLGAKVPINCIDSYQIVQIPLDLLGRFQDTPYTLDALSDSSVSQEMKMSVVSREIKEKPNGVVCEPTTGTIGYTFQNLFSSYFLGRKGFLDSVSFSGKNEDIVALFTPNGIDIHGSADRLMWVASLFRKNEIVLVDVSTGVVNTRKKLQDVGRGPDGLLCLEGGDVLIAGFESRNIIYLPWTGTAFGEPKSLVEGLDNPTDLVIGKSSMGQGQSLYVTTVAKWAGIFGRRSGRVIEITDIDERLGILKKDR